MSDFEFKKLLSEKAKTAALNAYAPYSGFRVGAAILCSDGTIYTGCNIENSSYSATVCAERVALFNAVSDGKKDFVAIAIAGGSESVGDSDCPPCGICRQTLSEFFSPDSLVLLVNNEGYSEHKLCDLLPFSFSASNLNN